MKYVAPIGSSDPNANYTDPVDGTIPAAAVEQPMREIASVIAGMGLVPSETDLTQLDQAIDLKVAAVQPSLTLGVDVASEVRPSTLILRDEAGRAQVADPAAGPDIATKAYLESRLADVVQELENLVTSPYIRGEIRFLPFRTTSLPSGWYFCNGDRFAVSSPAGQALLALGDDYHQDWSIVVENGTVNLPNLFHGDGRGYFFRAVDGIARQVGGTEGDAIRNITGWMQYFWVQGWNVSGAFYSSESVGNESHAAGGGTVYRRKLDFDASRCVPTAEENRPLNIGMTPAIYLGA